MAIATEIKQAMSEAVQKRQSEVVHPYEMTQAQYVDDRVRREIKQYERAIDYAKRELENMTSKVKPIIRQKKELTIDMWGRQLARLKSGEWQKVNTNYLHEQYAKMVKKAISTGQPVPQNIINQAPEYKAAQGSRERYEKGWKTSFANRSVAINEQMKQELGYKVKRQDGKPIESGQLEEIAKGVGEVEDALGPLHDLFDNTDITLVHTSGKHPFLSGFGGTYTPKERAVNVGVKGTNALGHELGHWLDHESGRVENLNTRLWGKTGHKAIESTSTAEASEKRYSGQQTTPLGNLIEQATFKINEIHEVRDIMKADYGKGLSDEEKAKTKLIRERLSPYWREPREVWARLVEQYIATKNGQAGVATDSPSFYEKAPGWWTKDEFAKMMPQVETLIKGRLRTLRGSDVAPPRKSATAEKKLEEFADDVKQLEKVTKVEEPKVETKPPEALKPIEPKPTVEGAQIKPGDVITDGLVNGRVIAEGTVRMGRQDVQGYQVVITSGHQAGQTSVIPKDQAKLVRSEPARAPESKPKPTKEPWEMTKQEYLAMREQGLVGSKAQSPELYYGNLRPDDSRRVWKGTMSKYHLEHIEQALKEGKPVPPEVLKDYPELGKKEVPKAGMPKVGFVTKEIGTSGESWKLTDVVDTSLGKEYEFTKLTPTGRLSQVSSRFPEHQVKNMAEAKSSPQAKVVPEPKKETVQVLRGSGDTEVKKLWARLDDFRKKELDPLVKRSDDLQKRSYHGEKGLEDELKKVSQQIAEVQVKGKPLEDAWHSKFNEVVEVPVSKVKAKPEPKPRKEEPAWAERRVYSGDRDAFGHLVTYKTKGQAEKGAEALKKRFPFYEMEVYERYPGVWGVKYRKSPETLAKEAKAETKPKKEPKQRKEIAALKPKPSVAGIQDKRSDRAIAIDRALLAKRVVTVDNAEVWRKNPNRVDIRGVDTPGRGRILPGVAYADKGKKRLSRKHHRGFKKIKFT